MYRIGEFIYKHAEEIMCVVFGIFCIYCIIVLFLGSKEPSADPNAAAPVEYTVEKMAESNMDPVAGSVYENYASNGTVIDVHDNTYNTYNTTNNTTTNNEAEKISYVIPATVAVIALFLAAVIKMCLSYAHARALEEERAMYRNQTYYP